MKKKLLLLLILLLTIAIVILNIFIKDEELLNKITFILTTIITIFLSYLTGIIKGKNGLINGLIIGISVSLLSLIIHYLFIRIYFDTLYIRMAIFMLSGAAGGVIGVNKKD